MSALIDKLRALPDVEEAPSQFHGEPAFWIDGREFIHFHGPDEIEIRLTRRLITGLDDERVWRRARTSDWVGTKTEYGELVLDLSRKALEAEPPLMEPTDQNRRAWDEIHRRRAEAMEERLGIPELVRERLPDLRGHHVLHLQCGTGESTAELEQLGALVTGVDISSEAIAVARTRAPNAAFIQAEVQDLPLELRRGRFELVYTGGVLTSLQDLDAWAGGIVGALRHGGFLLLYDEHPVLARLDDFLHWRESYFDETVQVLSGETHEQRHGRFWRLGQVVTALGQAGLTIRRLEEFPALQSWRRQDPRVPGEFILTAAKP